MSAFDHLDAMGVIPIWDGVIARAVVGRDCALSVVELEPNSVVPEHSHPNEQLGLVISGSVSFRIGEEERQLAQGGMWNIPPNVPHEVHIGPEGAVIIDVFSPPRQDWQALEQLDPRPHRL
jgi:unsaturated pyranuronate lyase